MKIERKRDFDRVTIYVEEHRIQYPLTRVNLVIEVQLVNDNRFFA